MSNLNPADLPENVSPEMLDQPPANTADDWDWDESFDTIHDYDYGYDDYEPKKLAVDDPAPEEEEFEELYDEFNLDDDLDDDFDWNVDFHRNDWLLWHANIHGPKIETPFDIAAEFDRLPTKITARRLSLLGRRGDRLQRYYYKNASFHDFRHAERKAERKKWNKPRGQARRDAARWRQERLAEFQKQDLMEIIRPVRRISHLDLLDEDGY